MKIKIIIAGSLLLAILSISLLAFSLYIKQKSNQPAPTPSPQTTALKSIPTPIPEEKAVQFKLELGPQSVGRVITTKYLSATASGWLVIYEDNAGKVGKLIETAIPPINPGVKRGETFILSEELQSGSYWALLYLGKEISSEEARQMFTVK